MTWETDFSACGSGLVMNASELGTCDVCVVPVETSRRGLAVAGTAVCLGASADRTTGKDDKVDVVAVADSSELLRPGVVGSLALAAARGACWLVTDGEWAQVLPVRAGTGSCSADKGVPVCS